MIWKLAFLGFLMAGNLNAKEGAAAMKDSIQNKVVFKKESKSVNVLFSEGFKAVGIGLLKGQLLEKHNTPTPAFLFVHEGKVEFRISGEKLQLKSGDFVKIPKVEEHEVEALEDARLILIK
jgi:quercetin dioxygenase-like cupin family protein